MNKHEEYQEALDRTKTLIDISSDKLSDKGKALMMESVDTLQQLVDKATPKKIIKIDKKDIDVVRKESITDIVGYMCECPNCKKIFGWLSISPYCKYCGQALDWSDEDGKS